MSDGPIQKQPEKRRVGDGTPGPGRPKGLANKTTRDVRKAIALFAENNVDKLQDWLDRLGDEDPGRAIDAFAKLIEYHIPKLGRQELTGAEGQPLTVVINKLPPEGV